MDRGSAPRRHYGMDWLRIGAFQLLILYHVGMAFVPWAYEVKMGAPVAWATIPMLITNPWRLSLLFVVSGYASAAMLARAGGPGAFVRRRLARLGLPLLFGMVVVVTPQPWVALVTQHGYGASFPDFLIHDYFRFRAIDGVLLPTWMHLWFVVYLLAYTLIYALLLRLPERWWERALAAAERLLAGPLLLPLGVAHLMLARGLLGPGWTDSHDFVNDLSAHATYLAMFLFGVLLRRSAPLHAAIARQWTLAGALAVLGWIVLAVFEVIWPGLDPLPPHYVALFRLARAVEGWGAIIALVGLADRFADHDHPWRATLAEAVFPFYLVHQTIIVVVGYWLLHTDTGGITRFVALVAATAAGCWAFYLAGRTIAPLRPLIGLKRRTGSAAHWPSMA